MAMEIRLPMAMEIRLAMKNQIMFELNKLWGKLILPPSFKVSHTDVRLADMRPRDHGMQDSDRSADTGMELLKKLC